jgi:hypothetical protein
MAASAWLTDVGAQWRAAFTWRLYSRTAESRTRGSDSAAGPRPVEANQRR